MQKRHKPIRVVHIFQEFNMLSFNEFREQTVVDLDKLDEELNSNSKYGIIGSDVNLDLFLESIQKILNKYYIKLELPDSLDEENFEEIFDLGDNVGLVISARTQLHERETYPTLYHSYLVDLSEMEKEMETDGEYETPGHFEITQSLLIRLMEFARETAKDDIILHKVVDNMNSMNEPEYVFDADDYDKIVKV